MRLDDSDGESVSDVDSELFDVDGILELDQIAGHGFSNDVIAGFPGSSDVGISRESRT